MFIYNLVHKNDNHKFNFFYFTYDYIFKLNLLVDVNWKPPLKISNMLKSRALLLSATHGQSHSKCSITIRRSMLNAFAIA